MKCTLGKWTTTRTCNHSLRKVIKYLSNRVTSYTQSTPKPKPVKSVVHSYPLVTRTIRVDKDRWGKYVKYCRELGTSTCFDIRSFIDARLGGESVVSSKQPLTIHQTVMYQVARPRRKALLPEDQQESTIQYFGSLDSCAHCPKAPRFLGHLWISKTHCQAMYLCKQHHSEYLKRERYSFKEV